MQTEATRTTRSHVAFAHPFQLGSSPEVYPAGVYEVETSEAVYEGLERNVHVRTSTTLLLRTANGTCDRNIDPEELEEALRLDGRHEAEIT